MSGAEGSRGYGGLWFHWREGEEEVLGRDQQCQGWVDSQIQLVCGTGWGWGKWKSESERGNKGGSPGKPTVMGAIFLVTEDHPGKYPGAQWSGVSSPAPVAIYLLQVLVPERACPLCYCPWLLPCYLPLWCCGAGFGGLEDLHSVQCHSGQRTGADLEVSPHCAGPLEPGGHDLGAGCSHPPRLVHRLHLHSLKLSAR